MFIIADTLCCYVDDVTYFVDKGTSHTETGELRVNMMISAVKWLYEAPSIHFDCQLNSREGYCFCFLGFLMEKNTHITCRQGILLGFHSGSESVFLLMMRCSAS